MKRTPNSIPAQANAAPSSRRIPFLTRLRLRLRHAWLLHIWLIASMLILPVPRLARADDEEDIFIYHHSESSVSVTVTAPDGTSGMHMGDSRAVAVNVSQSTWDVGYGSISGNVLTQNSQSNALEGTGISFSASGNGSISGASASTGPGGCAAATFTMGPQASTVTVTMDGSGATGSVTFETPVETWHPDHDEQILSASLGATVSTTGLVPGDTFPVQLHADYCAWSVLVSDLDPTRTKIDSYRTTPAIGALISWSFSSGNGSAGSVSPSTDSNGDATATVTMGTELSTLHADVSYATGNSTYANLDFSPYVKVWTHHHDETTITTSLSTSDAGTWLQQGESRWVTAQVMYNSVEVWYDDMGIWETRNPTSGAASGAPVSFSVDQGNGTATDSGGNPNPTLAADADGLATVLFTMANQDSRLVANASYATASSIGSLDFTLHYWWIHHSDSALGVTLGLSPNTVTANVYVRSWDVYTDGTLWDNRNYSDSPAGNAQVTFSAGSNTSLPIDPASGTYTVYTDVAGSVTMGYACTPEAVGNITANAAFQRGTATMDATASIVIGIPDAIVQNYGINDIHALRLVGGISDGLTWLQAYRTGYLDSLMQCGCGGSACTCAYSGCCSSPCNGTLSCSCGSNACSCAYLGDKCNGDGSCVVLPPACSCGGNHCTCQTDLACGTNTDPCNSNKCDCKGEKCQCADASVCKDDPDQCKKCACPNLGDKCTCDNASICKMDQDVCKTCACPSAGTTCTCNNASICKADTDICKPCECSESGGGSCSCANAAGCAGDASLCIPQYRCVCGCMNSCSAVDNCGGTYDPNRCNLPQPSATIDVSAMKGVVGNEISSVLGANGTRHFVSPKLNAAINQPNVVLTATVFSSGGSSFDALFWWEDNGVSSGTATHSVSRAAPGWHVVQIWRKSDDILMDQMSVWIVWATPSIDNNDAPIFNRTGDDGNYSRVIGGGQTRYIGFRMSIEPKELFTANADRPDLRGSSDPAHPVPEGEHALWDRPDLNFPLDPTKTVPNPATGLPYGAKWSTGAKNKWDISRKVQDVVYNPAPNRFDNFSDLTAHARYYNLKNPFDGVIINWPVDDLAGNDDVADRDPANPSEDNDPYTISTNAFLAHGLGEVAATDSPVVKAPSSYGHPVGQVYQQLMSFREFLRLQIGGTWFRLSPDLDWGMTLSIVIGSDGKWQDSGSSSYP